MAASFPIEDDDLEIDFEDIKQAIYDLLNILENSFLISDTLDYSQQKLTEIDASALLVVNVDEIKTFDLNSNFLSTIPNEIDRFQSLVTLQLSNNQLVQLPESLGCLKNLRHLHVNNNSLNDLSLPKEFQELKQLEIINLGGNHFKQFPYQLLRLTNLKEIYLGSNQIAHLPDQFHNLTK